MLPVIVLPLHDPAGLLFPHLRAVTPYLKRLFATAFVSVTTVTREVQSRHIAWLAQDSFFQPLFHQREVTVGEDFFSLYARAAAACAPDQILHLCFIDRVAFALQSEYREQFTADIQAVTQADTPLIFQRSSAAWATHPHHYRVLEQTVTQVGQLLFKKSIDYAWCHLALQAQQLQALLPAIQRRDLSIVAEIALGLQDRVQTKDVDWLAWEDPFIYGRSPQQLKAEREESRPEMRKRLAYVLPMLQLLYESLEAEVS